MYEKIKQFGYDFRVAIFAFLVCSAFSIYCLCNRVTEKNTIDGAIHDINNDITTAGSNIADAQKQISNVEDSLERASGTIRESRERAEELQRGFDECERLIDESLRINRVAQDILREAGNGNK